jgi:hypothetical protein
MTTQGTVLPAEDADFAVHWLLIQKETVILWDLVTVVIFALNSSFPVTVGGLLVDIVVADFRCFLLDGF